MTSDRTSDGASDGTSDAGGTRHRAGPGERPEEPSPAGLYGAGRRTAAAITRSIESLFEKAGDPVSANLDEVHPFLELIQGYLRTEGEGQAGLEEEIRRQAAELDGQGELDPLAGGIALLILRTTEADPVSNSGSDPASDSASERARDSAGEVGAALKMARELATAAVAARLVLHLAAERDEGARESWMRIASQLPDVMAPALADAMAEDGERGVRRAYVEAMSALGPTGEAQALRMLEDDRWFIVRNGVHLLAQLGDEHALPSLTVTLAHPDHRVRTETVLTLAKRGGEDAAMLLLGLLADPHMDVREAATMAVGVLKVERALRPLLERLEEEESEPVLVQILRSLGQIGDPGAVPAIEKRAVGSFFSRPRTAVRIAAYRALAGIGTPHARDVLIGAEQDGDPEVRTVVRGMLSTRGAHAAAGGADGRQP